MPKFREASVDEFISRRQASTRDGIVYRAAAAPKTFNAEERSQVFVMTDESVDSYGDIVKSGGADLYRFEKNPIALLNHSSMLIIGTWSEVGKKPQRLEGKVTIAKEGTAPHVDMAFNLMSQGILRGASIGFMPTKLEMRLDDDGDPMWCYIINEWELYECSVVSIPANPAALARSAINGDDIVVVRDYIEKTLDDWARTPEGLLIPRAEFEKAYKVVVEKIAADETAPAGGETIKLFDSGKDVELKSVAATALPTQITDDAATTFAKGIHQDADIDLTMKNGEWHIESVSIRSIPLELILPNGTTEADAKAFGEKIVAARAPEAAAAEPETVKEGDGETPPEPEDPEELPDEASKAAAEMAAFAAFLEKSVGEGDSIYVYYKLAGRIALEKGVTVAHTGTDKIDKFEFAAAMTAEHRAAVASRLQELAEKEPENKTETAPIVVNLSVDTTEAEAAAAKVEGIFTRLAKKFPMFFPKAPALEERTEPNIVPITPPVPPTDDEIAAARAKAAAVLQRLADKGQIAA